MIFDEPLVLLYFVDVWTWLLESGIFFDMIVVSFEMSDFLHLSYE